jgi:hypothetical protein
MAAPKGALVRAGEGYELFYPNLGFSPRSGGFPNLRLGEGSQESPSFTAIKLSLLESVPEVLQRRQPATKTVTLRR